MSRKRRIEEMIRTIERNGGQVGFAPDTPPEIVEQFLREVMQCPDCGAGHTDRPQRREH